MWLNHSQCWRSILAVNDAQWLMRNLLIGLIGWLVLQLKLSLGPLDQYGFHIPSREDQLGDDVTTAVTTAALLHIILQLAGTQPSIVRISFLKNEPGKALALNVNIRIHNPPGSTVPGSPPNQRPVFRFILGPGLSLVRNNHF